MKARNMVLCGLLAALLSICAWIYIPFGGVGFTLQTFAVALSLVLLGGKWGTVCIAVYLMLGIAGLPVFSGFRGGFGILLGATGGYITGFLFQALLYWLLTGALGDKPHIRLTALFAGQLLCYTIGTVWFWAAYGGSMGFGAILMTCVVPYILPDLCKILLACALTGRLNKFIYR